MRQHHVGDLIVAEQPNGERVPLGILTDRDIVISVIALALDPASLLVGRAAAHRQRRRRRLRNEQAPAGCPALRNSGQVTAP